jgi:hypothetical protein
MNERIRELAEQAGCDWWEGRAQRDMTRCDTELQKFAELIVRECMKESMDEIVDDAEIAQEKDPLIREYLNGNNQGIVDAVIRFRNHFGVEE